MEYGNGSMGIEDTGSGSYLVYRLEFPWSFTEKLVKHVSFSCDRKRWNRLETHKNYSNMTYCLSPIKVPCKEKMIIISLSLSLSLSLPPTHVGPMSAPIISSTNNLVSSLFSSCLRWILLICTCMCLGRG